MENLPRSELRTRSLRDPNRTPPSARNPPANQRAMTQRTSITTTHYIIAPIFAACFFASAYFYARDVRRSLREGATAFSGNHALGSADSREVRTANNARTFLAHMA